MMNNEALLEQMQKSRIVMMDVDTLVPYARNAKLHTDEQVDELVALMREVGYTQPILLDGDREIIAGHGRLLALKKLGMKQAPCIPLPHLTEAQKKAYRLADNQQVMKTGWDTDLLKIELNDLNGLNFDIGMIGFDDDFLNGLLTTEPEHDKRELNGDPDEVPESAPERVSRGDIWKLGDHRLKCGDSTSRQDVQELFGDRKAVLCFTSPPYADQREYKGGKELSTEHLATFISVAAPACELFAVNLGLARRDHEVVEYWDDYISEARVAGLKLLSWNVWDTGEAGSIGNQTAMFAITHEWIFVFGTQKKELNKTIPNKSAGSLANHTGNRQADGSIKKSEKEKIIGEFSQLRTVYNVTAQKARDDIDHPARFPVDFPLGYIEACTNHRDWVYEPFAGSGTTIIACEKTSRQCLAMELDPTYCDIILARWEKLTGKRAEKIS